MPRPQPLSLDAHRTPTDLTHGLFRFPGRFHPPLVTHLLGLHPESVVIGDPMVGSGTVAVEAVAYGKSGLYSDVDPLSCLLTRAKSRPVDPQWLLQTVQSIVRRAQPYALTSTTRYEARKFITDLEGSTQFRAPPDVFHWFEPYVVVNLCKMLQNAVEIEYSARRQDAVLATFAGVIRRLSRADPNTSSGLEVTSVRQSALRNGLRFDVAAEIVRKANQLAHGYRELRKSSKIGTAQVVQYDAKEWSNLCASRRTWPDLVITSPCYISAIEYWRRHKLEYSWLGLVAPENLAKVKSTFLGMGDNEPDVENLPKSVRNAHAKMEKIGRKRDAKTLARYFEDSTSWLSEIATVLKRTNGKAYVVVGSNTNHGLRLNTPLALQEIARNTGLTASVFLRYRIKNSYMQYPTKGKRIKVETVLKIVSR